jgi:hypothetical protein
MNDRRVELPGGMNGRLVEPEWLDALAPDDPRAVRSRRDLARVNALMSNAGIVAAALDPLPARPRIAELGAGDGHFASRMLRRLRGVKGHLVLVDRTPTLPSATRRALEALGWTVEVARADVFEWLASAEPCDAIYANLFLHHFDDAALGRVLAHVANRCTRFVACEPRRSSFALSGSRLLGLIGCNDVTRHDAVVSVRAGFTGEEITALWPDDARVTRGEARWALGETRAGFFSHRFTARRS